jgi:alkylhydroperoxidase family enzyme
MRLLTALFAVSLALAPAVAGADDTTSTTPAPLVSLDRLAQEARARVGAVARVPLGEATNVVEPSYVRAFGQLPHAAKPFAELVDAVLHRGTLPGSLKAAMGLRIAQINHSPYVAAHMRRLLEATSEGRMLLAAVGADTLMSLDATGHYGIRYADLLTRSIHGVTPEMFARTRGAFNDAEIVELTVTTAFFNFFTRFAEALRLPVEPSVLDGSAPLPARSEPRAAPRTSRARVGLLSDETILATAAALETAKQQAGQRAGWGIGMANSMRAMLQAPELALPWRAFGTVFREKETVGRDIKLQVSFAVSMANECRYCTLHQVLGLRRLGIDPGKLVAMKKDDTALTPREAVAVRFARKVTMAPGEVSDADYATLRQEFGEAGALEVLVQTCTFAFMNRFTDGLMLPSEDEAVRVYQETYGSTWP